MNLNPAVEMSVRWGRHGAVAGIRTSHATTGVHPPGEPMGQGDRVSVTSPDPVSDVSRLLRHSRHVSSGIHLQKK